LQILLPLSDHHHYVHEREESDRQPMADCCKNPSLIQPRKWWFMTPPWKYDLFNFSKPFQLKWIIMKVFPAILLNSNSSSVLNRSQNPSWIRTVSFWNNNIYTNSENESRWSKISSIYDLKQRERWGRLRQLHSEEQVDSCWDNTHNPDIISAVPIFGSTILSVMTPTCSQRTENSTFFVKEYVLLDSRY